MQNRKKGFTLIEVLISITLLSLVLMALYKSASILRQSNTHLYEYLVKSTSALKGSQTLYKDLIQADHNISIITEDKFHRLTILKTKNSLYGASQVKVVWLVYKENNTLLRVEGGEYDIPLRNEQLVNIDVIAEHLELFKVYKSKTKNKILAIVKVKNQEAQMFMAQNIPTAPEKNKNRNKLSGKPQNGNPNPDPNPNENENPNPNQNPNPIK